LMQAGITAMANAIPATVVDPNLVTSKALRLTERNRRIERWSSRGQRHRAVRVQDRHRKHRVRYQRCRAGGQPDALRHVQLGRRLGC
jgi:hypothetical protein